MKKNIKKLFALVLALVSVFTLSVTAFAANISLEDAKAIALKNAGYSASQVSGLRAEADYERGQLQDYEVEFYVKNANGTFTEYDYEISLAGNIIKKETDIEGKLPSAPAAGTDIGLAAAKKKAVEAFGLNESEIKFVKAQKEADDGRYIYDIEFCKGYDAKYSCEVIATSGQVVDKEVDYSRNFFDKLELVFEILFAQLFGRV